MPSTMNIKCTYLNLYLLSLSLFITSINSAFIPNQAGRHFVVSNNKHLQNYKKSDLVSSSSSSATTVYSYSVRTSSQWRRQEIMMRHMNVKSKHEVESSSSSSSSSSDSTVAASNEVENNNHNKKDNKSKPKSERLDKKAKPELKNQSPPDSMNDKKGTKNNNPKQLSSQNEEKESKQTTKKEPLKSVSARYLHDNDLHITTDKEGRITARPSEFMTKGDDDDDINQEEGGNTRTSEISEISEIDNEITGTKSKTKQKSKAGDIDIDNVNVNVNVKKADDDENKDGATKSPSNETMDPIPLKITNKSSSKKNNEKQTESDEIIKIPGIVLPPIIKTKPLLENIPKPDVSGQFNVVLTHCTADFDTLASAVGLAKLWSTSSKEPSSDASSDKNKNHDSGAFESSGTLPTFVVLPRGAHPSVQRFLGLHKHLFPIRSLKSLPKDLSKLHRLGLVDAQSRDRVGPAEILIGNADRVVIVDHHIDGTSDIPEATDYIIEQVGAVSTMVAERLREYDCELSEAEATLLALGIHSDTGSLCFDSATIRDAEALAWVMKQGASQAAIAEHAHSKLSREQQGVLTNALINANSTVVHGVTVSTVLLSADGFINGLAAVTQDALELSSSDVFLLSVVYDPKSAGSGRVRLQSKLLQHDEEQKLLEERNNNLMEAEAWTSAEAWKFGEEALKLRRLRAAFDSKDSDGSGYLEENEIFKVLAKSGIIASEKSVKSLIASIDKDGDGRIDFDEFVTFADQAEEIQKEQEQRTGKKPMTMIVIGRVKAGINMKYVNLNTLFQQFGGGGHAKAASCTVRLEDDSKAESILQGIVDELIETGLTQQPTVGDFMTSPVLSATPCMTEKQVEDLFVRYDVRALPVVDESNDVVGLVTYKEVAAAKQRLWNKEQKRIRQQAERVAKNTKKKSSQERKESNKGGKERKLGSALKGWMKQHVKIVETSMTMAEVEQILLDNDVGCIPVVADGTTQLVGMVTRTDLLRQHRYYQSLHYNNKGFADSIAARKPIIELRKKLKQFDLDED